MPRPHYERSKTYLREWRKHRGLTLVAASEAVGITHPHLSQMERGGADYTQTLLEALAKVYDTEPAALLTRSPTDPGEIWGLWDRAEPDQRDQIAALAETVLQFRPRPADPLAARVGTTRRKRA